MIGYSNDAKTRYHQCHPHYASAEQMRPYRAACDLVRRLHRVFRDNEEAALKKAAPHLSRCTKCWRGEK